METEIGEALDLLNTSFANSAVNAQVVLAGAEEVVYAEKEDLGQVLIDLKEPLAGGMDEVHTWRNERFADLVTLVLSQGDRCYEGYQYTAEGAAFASLAFSVVRLDCMVTDLGFFTGAGQEFRRARRLVRGYFPDAAHFPTRLYLHQ